MLQPPDSSEILAHWYYTPNEWCDFVDYELQTHRKTLNSYKKGFIGILVTFSLITFFLVQIPYLLLKPYQSIWREDVWGPVLGVAVITAILITILGVFRLLLSNKISRLNVSSGEVYITLTGVSVNDIWFSWEFKTRGWRFHNVRRKTVDLANNRQIEILEFKASATNGEFRNARGKVKAERIPIPTGKSAEAERIIERLLAENERFAENYSP